MWNVWKPQYIYIYIHIYIYIWSFFLGGFGEEVFPVSASVCDSRNWSPRSSSFVQAPSSGDGSNAPRPAASVPHLAGIGYVGWARQARSALFFVFWAVYARAMLGSWHICAELERKRRIYGKTCISKWASFVNWLLISSPPHFFMVTPRSVWPIVVRLLCRCFSISDFTVKYLCSNVRCLRGGSFPTQRHHYTQCPCRFFVLEIYNLLFCGDRLWHRVNQTIAINQGMKRVKCLRAGHENTTKQTRDHNKNKK